MGGEECAVVLVLVLSLSTRMVGQMDGSFGVGAAADGLVRGFASGDLLSHTHSFARLVCLHYDLDIVIADARVYLVILRGGGERGRVGTRRSFGTERASRSVGMADAWD